MPCVRITGLFSHHPFRFDFLHEADSTLSQSRTKSNKATTLCILSSGMFGQMAVNAPQTHECLSPTINCASTQVTQAR